MLRAVCLTLLLPWCASAGWTVEVTATRANLGTEEVEQLLTIPLEKALRGLDGVAVTTATVGAGITIVELHLEPSADRTVVRWAVEDRLAHTKLPLAVPPTVTLVGPVREPAFWLALAGDDLLALSDFARDQLAPTLRALPRVAGVEVLGHVRRQATIDLDPRQLQRYGLNAPAVIDRVAGFRAPGLAGRDEQTGPVLRDALDLTRIVVGHSSGQAVTLGQVARTRVAAEPESFAWTGGRPLILLGIRIQQEADAKPVRAALTRALAARQLPPGATLTVVADRFSDDPTLRPVLVLEAVDRYEGLPLDLAEGLMQHRDRPGQRCFWTVRLGRDGSPRIRTLVLGKAQPKFSEELAELLQSTSYGAVWAGGPTTFDRVTPFCAPQTLVRLLPPDGAEPRPSTNSPAGDMRAYPGWGYTRQILLPDPEALRERAVEPGMFARCAHLAIDGERLAGTVGVAPCAVVCHWLNNDQHRDDVPLVPTRTGQVVPLKDVAKLEWYRRPATLFRLEGRRAVLEWTYQDDLDVRGTPEAARQEQEAALRAAKWKPVGPVLVWPATEVKPLLLRP